VFDPSATSCTLEPYTFRSMYATSSERTRVIWTAHTYNVAFSMEIGHQTQEGTTNNPCQYAVLIPPNVRTIPHRLRPRK